MKKTTTRKPTPTRKKPLTKANADSLTVGPSVHVIKRKKKPAVGRATPARTVTKKDVNKPKKRSLVPASTTRKAKQIGRAVGTVLGRAIGNVERVVTKVMTGARPSKKK